MGVKPALQPCRTLLFAPGNHPRKVAKVFGVGADIVILDLEDAVAISEKAATRTSRILHPAGRLQRRQAKERNS